MAEYGITEATYQKLLRKQGGVCAVCKQPETTHGRGKVPQRLAVDHCKLTGVVRGLLCARCNRALGALHENIETMKELVRYAIKHQRNCVH